MGSCSSSTASISELDSEVPKDFKPVKAWSGHTYCVVQGHKGQLVESGKLGGNACNQSRFKLVKGLNGEIDQISISYNNMWVLLKDNTIWYKG